MTYAVEESCPNDHGVSDFKSCLRYLRNGHLEEALVEIQRALETAPMNPFYLSYAGLLVGLCEQRFGEAERLCREALLLRRNDPQLYLNLAEVYQTAGRPGQAFQILEKGLVSTGRDPRILRSFKKLGLRRNPVFSLLPRSHPLNRILGKWRHRLMGPLRARQTAK